MGYVSRIRKFLMIEIDLLDSTVRITAIAIFLYIVYHKTQQQIIAVACLIVAMIGVRKLNRYALVLIDKFEHSKKGEIPGIGKYDITEDKTKQPEAPVSLSKSLETAILRADSFSDALGKATRFIILKEWSVAAHFIEEALHFNPDDLNLHLQLVIIYGERIGDKEKAIEHCEEVLKRDPENVSAEFNLAVYTNHWKGFKYSLPIYLKAQELIEKKGLFGTEIEGKLNLFVGHDYKDNGEKEEAKKRYEKAISILEKLSVQGDQSSTFWLNNAKKSLKLLG